MNSGQPTGLISPVKVSRFPNMNMVDPMLSVDASLQNKKREMEQKLEQAKANRKNQ